MLLSLNWLKDYLAKPEIRLDPKILAEKLTMRGLAVEDIRKPAMGLDNVVCGKILKIEKHPNADRLQLTHVVISDKQDAEQLQIVCGAKNISEGDIVPVALPGAELPNELKIKVSKIRGVESRGMLCSGKELQLSDDSDGIMILPKHSILGDDLAHLIGSDDTIMEFELTPNRADCFSVIGLAREIAPVLRTKLREPKPARFRVSSHRTANVVKVECDDPKICPRYVARVIDNLKVEPSPDWIQHRLSAVGIRAVNNIVDVTNFVNLEFGQPLHAFDLRKIESGTVRVDTCKEPTDFTLLSGETVKLEPGDILILDGDRPVALAGIMGGQNSQINEDTTSILLESAAFPPGQIRRTAKRLGLQTESSKRFEKGVDLAGVAAASERAAALLRDCSKGNVYHPPIDTNDASVSPHTLSVDMRDVKKITGLKRLTSEQVGDALESIGIDCHKKSPNILSIRIPSFRLDIFDSADIIEEVARLIGYDSIPETFPLSPSTFDRVDESPHKFLNKARQILIGLGMRETIHYSFTSQENLSRFGAPLESAIKIQNPISEEMGTMRTSLLPSLLQTYIYNKNRRIFNQQLFEIARVYFSDPDKETTADEVTHVAGILSGNVTPPHWRAKDFIVDLFYTKGIVETLTRQLTTIYLAYDQSCPSKLFHPNRSATIKLGLKEVGYMGELHPHILKTELETTEPVVGFELNLDALRKYERNIIRSKSPSKFPNYEIDLALTVDKAITSQVLTETIKLNGTNLLTDVRIFDVYEGENIPMGKKSLAFHLTFSSPERTLLDNEISDLKKRIIEGLEQKHDARLRD